MDPQKEFAELANRVHAEDDKYANAEVKIDNYNIPYIYLTDEEIAEFNKDCLELGFDVKAVPLIDYVNINSNKGNYINEKDN